ncbi:general secretion pathway protein GspB [Alteromonas sp. ASW11-36]|uniref:General secretion pathway protein GspB n=1 Tax=Alteromonas arenosi TaxID=3055817 RepID=A0ABT7T0H7_9ALTE|nr:general secretion pathway protein GspB [Alteromonas sp. ASW11-36]MDM7861942.1 general secretion pathway protein GspB [Alteromonas sp. ASW11-36]
MLKIIPIKELQPGMMITQVVEQNGPVKIRKVGLVRSADMITGLAEMGVLSIEIDTEQSLELEPEAKPPSSMTQKLLQGEYDHASQVDTKLSEQFNRSLFLPSVNELPSMWQIYVKQVGVVAGVVMLGLTIGATVAIAPSWLTEKAVIASETPTEIQVPPAEAEQQQSPVVEPAEVAEQATPVSDKALPEPEAQTEITPPDEDSVAVVEPEQSSAEDEGEILTQTPASTEDELAAVSPELLERFNRALEDLENSPVDDEPETRVTVRDDIPRVDQLPARLLTQLPAMEFSAHMYASARNNRWVRVNGQQLYEGEWITDEVQLVNIEPQRVVLSFRDELFTMAALTDW